ncbi:MAG: hypothetical protein ACE3L7_23750 [Candidatus Pristimantibacillus sp.]
MRKYRYIVIGLILHSGWFALAFYTYQFTGAAAFSRMYEFFNDESGTKSSFYTIVLIMQISLLLLSLFILVYHIWFLKKSTIQKKVKALQLLLVITVSFLAGGIYIYWWTHTPPMSEQAAIKYAEKQVKGNSNNLKFHSIHLSGQTGWIVKFEEVNNPNSCTNVKIYRGYSYRTYGDCE